MEKLSERLKWAIENCVTAWNQIEEDIIKESINRLAYYEDLEGKGRLRELPCAVGDMVYRFQSYFDEATLQSRVKIKPCRIATWTDNSAISEDNVYLDLQKFGNTVFLTYEEAAHRLHERTIP